MAEIVLFGGTSEGRALAELARSLAAECVVCVATEYGESLLEESGFCFKIARTAISVPFKVTSKV